MPNAMTKKIFVGSSSEALTQARLVAEAIKRENIEVVLWDDFFESGDITFQALEEGARWFTGAVFLATPDDPATIRGKSGFAPRANVMLELGLFSSVLGRKRIALCVYGEVALPSDIAGFTYIPMGTFHRHEKTTEDEKIEEENPPILPEIAATKLSNWSNELSVIAPNMPYASVHHGYSGKWKISFDFDVWGGMNFTGNNHVTLQGIMILIIPRSGLIGYGAVWVDSFVRTDDCYIHFRVMDDISFVRCRPDGSLYMESKVFVRQRLDKRGDLPGNELVDQDVPGPFLLEWELRPSEKNDGELCGEHTNMLKENVVRSHAKVVATKIDDLQGQY